MRKLFLLRTGCFILLIILMNCPLKAQLKGKHKLYQAHWVFGYGVGLSFLTGQPIGIPKTQILSVEACASVSDPHSGKLLFYTNGEYIWDSNNQKMEGGFPGFGGTPGRLAGSVNNRYVKGSAAQGALIVPMPGNDYKYYVFYISDAEGAYRGLIYSIIDTKKKGVNGSKGDFEVINKEAIEGENPFTTEQLAAAPNCSGGYWIVVHAARFPGDNKLLAFELTTKGLNPKYVESNSYPSPFPLLSIYGFKYGSFGQMEFSPNNKMMAITASEYFYTEMKHPHPCRGKCELHSFDPSTGTFHVLVDSLPAMYGVAFSPDSKLLYTSTCIDLDGSPIPSRIIQHDVSRVFQDGAKSIKSFTGLEASYCFFGMEAGPDGKLYFPILGKVHEGEKDWRSSISVINFPNKLMTEKDSNACGIELNAVPLTPGSKAVTGLPNMINALSFLEQEPSSLVFQPASQPQLTVTNEYIEPDSSLTLMIAGHLNGAAYWKIYADSINGKLIRITVKDTVQLKPKQTTTYFIRAEGGCLPPGMSNSITIYVNKVFWQTWWFIVLCSLAISGLMLLIFILQFRRLKKREEEKTEMHRRIADMEMKALRLQMNPHFIFNAINSIQYFVMRNDQNDAYSYLSTFSKLMRNVLENSRHTFIPIKKELETLDLYVKLEMLRFDEGFEQVVSVDEKIDIGGTLIPPMLIQPYLENAIWHGLLHKKDGTKKIMLELKKYTDYILCVIEDTGVGRSHSRKFKNKHTTEKSLGMLITKERLNLLTQTNTRSFSVEIIDLTDEQGNATGTRVELTIPIIKI